MFLQDTIVKWRWIHLHLQTWRKHPGFFLPFTATGVASKTGPLRWESVSLEKNQGKVGGSRCIKGIIHIYIYIYVVMYVWRIKHLQSFYMYWYHLPNASYMHRIAYLYEDGWYHRMSSMTLQQGHQKKWGNATYVLNVFAQNWWKAVFFSDKFVGMTPHHYWQLLRGHMGAIYFVCNVFDIISLVLYIRCIQKDSVSNPKKSICIH